MLSQTLLLVVLFVVLMAMLPLGIKWMQRRTGGVSAVAGANSRVISAVAVGPQQRVVTVEVGPEGGRTWLVLGVTPQAIVCLHHMPSSAMPTSVSSASGDAALVARAP